MEKLSEQKRDEMNRFLKEAGMLFPSEKQKIAHLSGRYSRSEIHQFLNKDQQDITESGAENPVRKKSVRRRVVLWYIAAFGVLLFRQYMMSIVDIESMNPHTKEEVGAYLIFAVIQYVMLVAPLAIIIIISAWLLKNLFVRK